MDANDANPTVGALVTAHQHACRIGNFRVHITLAAPNDPPAEAESAANESPVVH